MPFVLCEGFPSRILKSFAKLEFVCLFLHDGTQEGKFEQERAEGKCPSCRTNASTKDARV